MIGLDEPPVSCEAAEAMLALFTDKQREALDLLVEHKTSKEIARVLGISPHTVDQRINSAKSKLRLSSRGELAAEYQRLTAIYQRPVYGESYIGSYAIPLNKGQANEAEQSLIQFDPQRLHHDATEDRKSDYLSVRDDEGLGQQALRRLALVVAGIALLMLALAGGLAIFAQLSEVFAG